MKRHYIIFFSLLLIHNMHSLNAMETKKKWIKKEKTAHELKTNNRLIIVQSEFPLKHLTKLDKRPEFNTMPTELKQHIITLIKEEIEKSMM